MSRSNVNIKKRILASTLAVAVVASVLGAALYLDSNKAHAAKVTLRGIQELANSHSEGSDEGRNPFIIVEVVNDYSNARLGYLVGGEEPVDLSGPVKGIKDMPSSAERTDKLGTFDGSTSYLSGTAYSWSDYHEAEDGGRSSEIRGSFYEVPEGTGDYKETAATDGYTAYNGSEYDIDPADGNINDSELAKVNEDGITLGRKVSRYTFDSISSITKLNEGDDMPRNDQSINTSGDAEAWNYQYFAIDSTISGYGDIASLSGAIFRGTGDTKIYVGNISSNTYDEANKLRTITDSEGYTLKLTYDADSNITGYTTTGAFLGGTLTFNASYDWTNTNNVLYAVVETNNTTSTPYRISDDGASGTGNPSVKKIDGEPGYYSSGNVPAALGPYYFGGEDRDGYSYIGSNPASSDYKYKFEADYSRNTYETFKYDGGFVNYEWFKQYVFDRTTDEEYEDLSIDVRTIKASDLTQDDVDKAGLIYFNYAPSINADNDFINGEIAKSIVSKVAEKKLSVMMEYATYADADAGSQPYLKGMALALMKKTVTAVDDVTAVTDSDLWFGTKDPTTVDISYAYNTVFVNDNLIGSVGSIVGEDFHDKYSSDKISAGFEAVEQENEAEYRYIELQATANAGDFNMDISKATSIRYILNKNTNRTAVKNKLNILDIEPYGTDQYTEVLEGQTINTRSEDNPLYQLYTGNKSDSGNNVTRYEHRDIMTKGWVEDNLSFTGGKDNVVINQMGTKEFICTNEDLNADYDLIYIGMDKAMLNTEINGNTKTDGETKHNRSELDGYVYTHVGDQFSGFNNVRFGEPNNATVVSAGNDITPNKVRELKSYIKAGYAVVLSDGFFDSERHLNTHTLDKSSRMYELMDWLFNSDEGKQYLGKNVMKKGDLEASNSGADTYRDIFSTFLNLAKLELDVQSVPTAYDGTDESYLKMEMDGTVWLKFKVGLTNNSAIDTSEETTYDCNLYIDLDADGNYEEVESLDGIIIDGESEGDDGHFHLSAGSTYEISRVVPDGYVGFLSWKLEFVQNGRAGETFAADAVRRSIIGYSAVTLIGDKPKINVLQIVSDDQDPKNVTADRGGTNNLDLGDARMMELYSQINEFDVRIYQTNADKYIRKEELPNVDGAGFFTGTYYDFLAQFDIVVLGFCDNFQFCSPTIDDSASHSYNIGGQVRSREVIYKDAALGIREYAMSGRSMLFTHDLTHSTQEYISSYNSNANNGYFLTYYLRDIMGMDRYGYTVSKVNFNYGFDSTNTIKEYKVLTDKSTYGDKQDAGDTYGFTDSLIVTRLRPDNGNGYNTGEPDVKYALGAKRSFNTFQLSPAASGTIQSINRGQITEYPFHIPEEANVAATHAQYYQLNMDTNNEDEFYDDDIVVWYALSNDNAESVDGNILGNGDERFYRANYKDGRNNYYIYTKGNITYTGAGHSMIGQDMDAERKLFVNTLVASYASGAHSPKVMYKENPTEGSANINCTYIPYDPELEGSTGGDAGTDGGFLDNQLTINFKTMNSNIRSYSTGLEAAYYMPVASGGDITIGTQQYKIITPTSLKIVNDSTGKLEPVTTDFYHLKNFRIYQATFDLSQFEMGTTGTTLKKDNTAIYIRLGLDKLETIENGTLPGNESLTGLDLYATRLFDLE